MSAVYSERYLQQLRLRHSFNYYEPGPPYLALRPTGLAWFWILVLAWRKI